MVGQDLTHSTTGAPINMIKKTGALQNIKIFRQTKQIVKMEKRNISILPKFTYRNAQNKTKL